MRLRLVDLAQPLSVSPSTSGSAYTQGVYSHADDENGRFLATLSGSARHKFAVSLLRKLDEGRHPLGTFSTASGDGDWKRDGRSVLVRSAAIRWEQRKCVDDRFDGDGITVPRCLSVPPPTGRWICRFGRLDVAYMHAHEMQLALITPGGIHTFVMSPQATGTGQNPVLQISAASGILGWQAALEFWILPKLHARPDCSQLEDMLEYTSPQVAELVALARRGGATGGGKPLASGVTADAFRAVPWADLAHSVRRRNIELTVRRVDCLLHPAGRVEDAPRPSAMLRNPRPPLDDAALTKAGASGASLAATRHAEASVTRRQCTWWRDGEPVLCRQAQLQWHSSGRRWRVLFSGVRVPPSLLRSKRPASRHECGPPELLLALYTPRGLYVYRHDFLYGLSRAGKLTATQGHQVTLYGPASESEWGRALDAILHKLDHESGCERLAFVSFS